MKLSTRSFGLVALAAASVFGASQSQAAVILVSKTQSGAPTVADDRNLLSTGPSGTVNGSALTLGEVAADSTYTKPYIPFLLSAADITDVQTAGSTITLSFTALSQNIAGQTFSIIGFQNRGSSTASVGAADYTGGVSVVSGIVPTGPASRFNIDVSSFVKTQVPANSAIVFRMQLSGQTASNSDGLINGITVSSGDNTANSGQNVPMLTIAVPEPTSIAGLALGSTLLLRRRRNVIAK